MSVFIMQMMMIDDHHHFGLKVGNILKNVPWLGFCSLRHLERDPHARESGVSACQRPFHPFRMNGLHTFATWQSSRGSSTIIRWPNRMLGAAVNGRLGIAHSAKPSSGQAGRSAESAGQERRMHKLWSIQPMLQRKKAAL